MTQPQAPSNVNIDPNAGLNPYGTKGDPNTAAVPTAPSKPAYPTPAGPASPDQPSIGGYTPAQIVAPTDQEWQDANKGVDTLWTQVLKAQENLTKAQTNAIADPASLQAANNALTALYQDYGKALDRVQVASASRAKTLNDAIHNGTIDPQQVKTAQAQADSYDAQANLNKTQAQVLSDGADTQKSYVAAQAAQASQAALLDAANADLAKAQAGKVPSEIAQAQATANGLQAQADQTKALLPGLLQKQKDDSSLSQSQVGLNDANANATTLKTAADAAYTTAQTQQIVPAQATELGARAGAEQAQGAGTLADIQKNLLGGMYGLQDKVNAIRAIQSQVFGPGGSGDPSEANDLLGQYVTSSIAGTTPYESNVAAANAGLTSFGTQASLANAAQSAAASRASALTGFGGSALGSLLGVMKDAPAGSTALGGAFQDVMNQMQSRLGGQAAFAPPQMPQAPQLPRLLQNLAGGGVSAVQPAGGPAPPPMGMPPAAPPQTSAPITINVGGQPAATQAALAPMPAPFPGASTAGAFGGLPGVLQQHAPAGLDTVHQLWSNELQGGAVRSPYASGGIGGA